RSRMSRALPSSTLPSAVNTGRCPERSNSRTPSCASRLPIATLTPDCTRYSLLAAARKLPASATVTKVRIWSRVSASSMFTSIDRLDEDYSAYIERKEGALLDHPITTWRGNPNDQDPGDLLLLLLPY